MLIIECLFSIVSHHQFLVISLVGDSFLVYFDPPKAGPGVARTGVSFYSSVEQPAAKTDIRLLASRIATQFLGTSECPVMGESHSHKECGLSA